MSRRILLADDSVTIQKVIELTFMDDDYEVRAVGNGDEALAMLTALTVDFVIADVHMPGASGYEVCRRSKQLRPEVPVLLLVGTFEPFDEAQARECGANSYLKKPFDSQELLGRVHDLLGASAPAAAGSPPAAAEAAAPAGAAGPPSISPVTVAGTAAAPATASQAAAGPGVPATGAAGDAGAGAPGAGGPAAGEPAAKEPAAAAATAEPAAEAPAAGASAGRSVRLTGGIEPAASWQEFELEAEAELIPDPWPDHQHRGPTSAEPVVPASPQHFEQPFALGDLEEPEAAGVPGGAAAAPPATAPATQAAVGGAGGGAGDRPDRPFTLGDGLDDRAFLLDDAEEPGAPLRATAAEPFLAAALPVPAPGFAGARERPAPPAPPAAPATPETLGIDEPPRAPLGAPVDLEHLGSLDPLAPLGDAALLGSLEEAEAKVTEPAGHPASAEPAVSWQPAAPGNGQPAAAAPGAAAALGQEDVERIARRVVELIGDKVVRDIAWEVIPDLAEVVIKDRLRELESQIE